MNCNEIQYQLPDYLAGKLSGEEQTFVSEHIASCRSCRMEAEHLAALIVEIKRAAPWAPPRAYFDSLLPRIHQRIDEKTDRGLFCPG